MMNKKKSNEREDFFKKKYQYKITKRRNLKLFIKNTTLLNIGKNRVVGNNLRGRRRTLERRKVLRASISKEPSTGEEGHWSGGVRGIRSTFQMPEKQGDKDNMSGEKF